MLTPVRFLVPFSDLCYLVSALDLETLLAICPALLRPSVFDEYDVLVRVKCGNNILSGHLCHVVRCGEDVLT